MTIFNRLCCNGILQPSNMMAVVAITHSNEKVLGEVVELTLRHPNTSSPQAKNRHFGDDTVCIQTGPSSSLSYANGGTVPVGLMVQGGDCGKVRNRDGDRD
jgi:hypothetical protein